MSSEKIASAVNILKGNLAAGWDIISGSQGESERLGIARRFGGSAAAYSLRDIGAVNGRVVRVRRDSDDAEEDFSANQVASGALEAFVGSGNNGFVSIWYDQSTSGNNCTQSSTSVQPYIVENGTFTGVFMKEIAGGSEPNARNLRIDDIQTTDLGNNFGLIWVGTVDDTYSTAHPTTLVGANRNIVTQNQGTVGLNIKLSGDEFTLKNETSGSANVNSGFPTFTYTTGDKVSVAGTCVGRRS